MRNGTCVVSVLVASLAIVLVACSPLAVEGRNLDGTTWRAATIGGEQPAAGNEPTLVFESGGVHGYGGCNWFTGQHPISVVAGRIVLGDILITTGGCLDAIGETTPGGKLEPVFMRALWTVDRIAFRGDQLVLSGPEGELVFEREP